MKIHELYHPGEVDPLPQPGERLGFSLLKIPAEEKYLGMVVTIVGAGENYYDPLLCIPGDHFIWSGQEWVFVKTVAQYRTHVTQAVRAERERVLQSTQGERGTP